MGILHMYTSCYVCSAKMRTCTGTVSDQSRTCCTNKKSAASDRPQRETMLFALSHMRDVLCATTEQPGYMNVHSK